MGKNKLSSGLINVVTYDTNSNISLNSGSNLLMSLSGSGTVTIPGNLVVLGGISGSTAESASYSLNADKIDNLDSTQLVLTSSFNSYTSSASSSLGSLSGSVATTTLNLSSSVSSSIGDLSGSIATTTSGLSSTIGNLSSSIATTTSGLSSSIATTTSGLGGRITTIEGNYATTGSNIFVGSQVITGSLYITNDMVVQGCSCLQNITASAVSIGTNTVVLNTATPAVRFAGISVQDSGSNAGVTGSIFWDGLCNKWVYSNPSGIGYSGGMLLSGPRTSTLGSESPLTCNYLAKSGGGDHLYDSCIIDDGTTVCVNATLKANGQVCGLMGTFSCVGIGMISPASSLHIIKALGSDVINIGESGTGTRFAIGQEAGYTGNYINSRNIDLKLQAYCTGGSGGNIHFQTGTDGTACVTTKMFINSSGLVSINQTCGYAIFNVTGIDCAWGEGIVMNPAPNGYNAINFRAEGRTGSCFIGTWQIGKISSGETSSGEVFSLNRAGLTGGIAYRADASQQWKTNGDSIFGFKVGIGTCTPDYLLTVDGQVANFSTVNLARFYASKGQTEAAYLQIQGTRHSTSGVRRMVLDAMDGDGNNANLVLQQSGGGVLVNTTTNSGYGVFNTYKLPVSSTYVDQIVVQSTGNYPSLRLGTYDAYDGVVATTGNDLRILSGLNVTTENHSIRFYTSFNGGTTGAQNYERMRIEYNGNVLIGAQTTSKGLLRVAGNAEVCKTLFFNGGDGLGGAIINAGAAPACATPAYNLRTMFSFNDMQNFGAYLFIHTGYNTVTTKNSTITGIVNNGQNQTISILATTLDSGATAPSVHSTSNWCIAFCWPNAANSNTKFIALAG